MARPEHERQPVADATAVGARLPPATPRAPDLPPPRGVRRRPGGGAAPASRRCRLLRGDPGSGRAAHRDALAGQQTPSLGRDRAAPLAGRDPGLVAADGAAATAVDADPRAAAPGGHGATLTRGRIPIGGWLDPATVP